MVEKKIKTISNQEVEGGKTKEPLGKSKQTQTENFNERVPHYYFDLKEAIVDYLSWKGTVSFRLNQILKENPDHVMANILFIGYHVFTLHQDIHEREMKNKMKHVANLLNKEQKLKSNQSLTPKEQIEFKHFEALEEWASGYFFNSKFIWEQLISENACDIIALKFLQDCYHFIGEPNTLCETFKNVVDRFEYLFHVTEITKLTENQSVIFGYVHGMYSFVLNEVGEYKKSKSFATNALAMNKDDIWAIHSLCNYFYLNGEFNECKKLLLVNEAHWQNNALICSRMYWHLAICFIELGEFKETLNLFDNRIVNRIENVFDLVNASSILFKLFIEQVVDRTDFRFELLKARWKPKLNKVYNQIFDQCHIFMIFHQNPNDENDESNQIIKNQLNQIKKYKLNFNEKWENEQIDTETDVKTTTPSLSSTKQKNQLKSNQPTQSNINKDNEEEEEEEVDTNEPYNIICQVYSDVAINLIYSIIFYTSGNYDKVLNLLPNLIINQKLHQIGGTIIQRQIFIEIALDSCLKCLSYYEKEMEKNSENEKQKQFVIRTFDQIADSVCTFNTQSSNQFIQSWKLKLSNQKK